MVDVKLNSSIQKATETLSNFELDKANQLIETLNQNLSKENLQLPNISIGNITGDVSKLDANITQSLNDDLLKTINEATGAISGITGAFDKTMDSFSDALKGMSGGIGGLSNLTAGLDELTSGIGDLLNITDNLNLPDLDLLGDLTASFEGFLGEIQGLLSEISNVEKSLTGSIESGLSESLVSKPDGTASNPDYYLDNFNTTTIKDSSLAAALISNGQIPNGTVFKNETTKEYFVAENGSAVSLWDYNVNRVRNGQIPFKPRGAITDRKVQGVPIYKSSE